MVAPKSLSGQPLDQVWIRLARKGFWSYHTAMSSGGSFRSSWWARFHGALRFLWHFFYKPNKAIWTLCAIGWKEWGRRIDRELLFSIRVTLSRQKWSYQFDTFRLAINLISSITKINMKPFWDHLSTSSKLWKQVIWGKKLLIKS